jgi:hypothetical protein
MEIRVRDTLESCSSETVESSPFFAKPDVGHDESNEMQYKAVERKRSKERENVMRYLQLAAVPIEVD